MSGRNLSRRKLAEFVAGKLRTDEAEAALRQVAAYLVETKQTRTVSLLVRDIEEVLMRSGTVVADITSARPLSAAEKSEIAKILDTKDLQVREAIDASVLGGVRVEVAGKRLDATLRRRIDLLKETELRRKTT